MTDGQQLIKLRELRGKIVDVMIGSVDAAELDSYTYSDADGSQSTKRRNPKDLMDWLNDVDRKIAILERKLQGGGVMTFGTNRYG